MVFVQHVIDCVSFLCIILICSLTLFTQTYGYSPNMVVPHGSYLLNCGSSDPKILHESRESLVDDLQRCRLLGLPHFNFHPGTAGASSLFMYLLV